MTAPMFSIIMRQLSEIKTRLGYDSSDQVTGSTKTSSEDMAGCDSVKLNGSLDNEAVLTRSKAKAWKKNRHSRSPKKVIASSSPSPRSSQSSPSPCPPEKTRTRRGTYKKFRRKPELPNGYSELELQLLQKQMRSVKRKKPRVENGIQDLEILKDACTNRKLVVRLPVSTIDGMVNGRPINGFRMNGIKGDKIRRVRGPDKKPRKKYKKRETSESASSPDVELTSPKEEHTNLNARQLKRIKMREVARQNLKKARMLRNKKVASSRSFRNSSESSSSESPKKRLRETELAHLLNSPILESKLRNVSESSGKDELLDTTPTKKIRSPYKKRSPKHFKCQSPKKSNLPNGLSQTTKVLKKRGRKPKVHGKYFKGQVIFDDEPRIPQSVWCPISPCHSPISLSTEPNPKTVRFQHMVNEMSWQYSFEETPSSSLFHTKYNGLESQAYLWNDPTALKLPYEMENPYRKSRCKPVSLARKSPRCHASTLAMLSSENPTGSSSPVKQVDEFMSVFPDLSTISTDSDLYPIVSNDCPSPPRSYKPMLCSIDSQPTNRGTKKRRCSGRDTRPLKPNSLLASFKTNPRAKSGPAKDITLVQYVWDSIQYLSDPYVMDLLASTTKAPEEINGFTNTTTGNSGNSSSSIGTVNNGGGKRMIEAAARRASLRSGDTNGCPNGAEVSMMPISSCSKQLVSSPKGSPRNNHGTSSGNSTSTVLTNGYGTTSWDGGESHSRHSCRSPALRSCKQVANNNNAATVSSTGNSSSSTKDHNGRVKSVAIGPSSPAEIRVSNTTANSLNSPKAISGCAG